MKNIPLPSYSKIILLTIRRVVPVALALGLASVTDSARAATATWQNTGTDFYTAGDFLGGSGAGGIPGTGDTVLFNSVEVTNPNLGSSGTISALVFSTSGTGYTLSASPGATLTLTGGTVITGSNTTGTNTISANLIFSGGGTKDIQTGGVSSTVGSTLIISGNISQSTAGTSLSVDRAGTTYGTLTLSGSNSFSGGVSFAHSGLGLPSVGLNIDNNYALGSGTLTLSNNTLSIGNNSGGAITVGNALTLSSASGNGVSFSGPNTLTFTGTTTLAGATGNKGIQDFNLFAGTMVLSGPIVGGTQGLGDDGYGTLILSGTNTFPGAVVLAPGSTNNGGTTGYAVLEFTQEASLYSGSNSYWTAANISVGAPAYSGTGVLAFMVGGTGSGLFTASDIDTIKSLYVATGGGPGGGAGGLGNGVFLGLDTTNGNFTYNSNIANTNAGSNAIGLMKLGANSLTLGGGNSYTGPTVVSTGTLIVSGSLTGSTTISVANGATLQLSASNALNTSTVLTLAGGTLNTNTENVTISNLTLSGSSTLSLGGTAASTASLGDSHLKTWTGTLTITNWSAPALDATGTNHVFFGGSSTGLTSAQLADIFFFNPTINGQQDSGLYSAAILSTGEVVALAAVPEPQTWGMILSGAGILLAFQRSHKRRMGV